MTLKIENAAQESDSPAHSFFQVLVRILTLVQLFSASINFLSEHTHWPAKKPAHNFDTSGGADICLLCRVLTVSQYLQGIINSFACSK